jgi:glycerate 2-kinase
MVLRNSKKVLDTVFHAALRAVDPYESVRSACDAIRSVYLRGGYRRLIVVGFGKASCPMAEGVEDRLPDIIDTCCVVTKYGHCRGYPLGNAVVHEAGHPLPDENGTRATDRIVHILKDADEGTLVVCLISGGGSALLVSPCDGITLRDKQAITDSLLKSGADIYELNTVRKHLSRVKGGRLAELAYPAKIISLIISDVVGDRLGVIASGPTSPDDTTYGDALHILSKYGLEAKAPRSVLEVLTRGAEGVIPETPKEGDRIFGKVTNLIIGNNKKALEAAKDACKTFGLHAEIVSSTLTGDAAAAGKWLAEKAIGIRNKGNMQEPLCLISGGETTVNVKGQGTGGRNMELALSFGIGISGVKGVTLLSAGTDGTDGPTDAAGAVADGEMVHNAVGSGIDPEMYLADNDSYTFFKKAGGLFVTGPTGTNVMDIQVILIE